LEYVGGGGTISSYTGSFMGSHMRIGTIGAGRAVEVIVRMDKRENASIDCAAMNTSNVQGWCSGMWRSKTSERVPDEMIYEMTKKA
jgi:hypothetical protein